MSAFTDEIKSDLAYIINDADEFGELHTIDQTQCYAIVHASGFSRDSKVVSDINAMTSLSLCVMNASMAAPPQGSVITLDGVCFHVFDVKSLGIGGWRATLQRIEG